MSLLTDVLDDANVAHVRPPLLPPSLSSASFPPLSLIHI